VAVKPRYEVVNGSGEILGRFEAYSDALLWVTFFGQPSDTIYDTETEEILAEVDL
jgi:hypothetical protein